MPQEPLKPERDEQLLVDQRLYLHVLAEADAEVLHRLVDDNRQHLAEYLPWAKKNTLHDSLEFIKKIKHDRSTGSEYGFGIYLDGALIGHVSLMHTDDGKEPEIGYWVSKESSGAGVTTKVAERVTYFGFETLRIDSIVIKAAIGNIASNKIAQKLGYKLSGVEESDNGTIINVWRKTNEQ